MCWRLTDFLCYVAPGIPIALRVSQIVHVCLNVARSQDMFLCVDGVPLHSPMISVVVQVAKEVCTMQLGYTYACIFNGQKVPAYFQLTKSRPETQTQAQDAQAYNA